MKCDLCGRDFKNAHALSMHKVRSHQDNKWTSRKKASGRRPAKKPAKRFDVVLKEVYTDSKRILLVDEAGDWWIARKLDV